MSRQNADTAHARGHLLILLLRLSFRVRLTVCCNFPLQTGGSPSRPSQMPGVRLADWQCSGERLSAHAFLPHEVSICCTWQAAGSAQFACLVKSDTDKKRLGENWHTEENPRLQQIFDDVIFAGLEMEADVDICVTSAQSGLSLSLVVSLASVCLSLSYAQLARGSNMKPDGIGKIIYFFNLTRNLDFNTETKYKWEKVQIK